MGSIKKRDTSQYQAIVRRKGFQPQYKTFESRKKAQDWITVIESEMKRGVFTDRSELERTTLAELLERYLSEVTPGKIGERQERSRIKKWLNDPLSYRTIANLRPVDFAKYRDDRLKEVSGNTVRLELAVISAMFNHARLDWSMAVDNPIKNIRSPKVNPGRERRLVDDEEQRLLLAARQARANAPQLEAAISLALETGVRQGSLARLEWKNVDLKKNVIWIPTKDQLHKQKLCPVPLT